MAESKPHDALDDLAQLERNAALAATTDVQRSLSRQRFLARLEAETAAPRWKVWHWAVPAAAVLYLAAALLLFLRTRSLTFEVRGAELSSKYVSALENQPAELRFSDESTLVAAPGSRLRIEDTNPHGARVLIERGRTSVHVMHQRSTAWTFGAGPFEVHVTGTRFDLAWDPASETCDLTLREGSVEVRGLAGSGPVVVRAGQRFEGDARRRTMQVLALEADSTPLPSASGVLMPAPASAPAPSTVAEASGLAAAPAERTPRIEPRQASWSDRVAQGKFKEVVSDAETRGVSNCLANCSMADLRALSDAARYSGKGEVAERSLTALRQRFSGPQASEAAFLLGRMHEKRGANAMAMSFYDSYLSEAPSGAFAAEALAGKLRTVRATQGQAAAQPLAREYLRRFPKGVHVSTAREILGDE